MLIRTVWLPAVLLASFHLVSVLGDIPPSIDEVIRDANDIPFSEVLRRAGRSAQDDLVEVGSDMAMTMTQFKRLYEGEQGRNDSNIVVTPWTNGVIPYNITPGDFNDDWLALIREAMNDWEAVSCVRFELMGENEDPPYFVKIYNGRGCSAQVGMVGKGQYVKLSPYCNWRGTITHEFGHALGLIHEHQRAERDQYIRVNYYAASERFIPDLMKYGEGSNDKMGLGYDYLSIMHYAKDQFSNPRKGMQTVFPRYRNMTDVIGHAMKPSYLDAKLVNLMYKCSDKCQRPQICGPDCFLTANCSCLCERDFRVQTCTDRDGRCTRLQQEGMCESQADYMKLNCPVTCDLCNVQDNSSYVIPGPCRDMNATCNDLARNGQCDRHPETMLVDCRRSCDFCPEDINRPMPRPGRCEDRDSVCSYWKNVGKCVTHRQAISSRCPGACETCDVDTGIPSGCRDKCNMCLGWAFNGYCESNPEFMNGSCSLSCGTCPGLTPLNLSAITNDIHYMCLEWGSDECDKRFGFMRVHCRETCREKIEEYGDCYDSYGVCVDLAKDGHCNSKSSWIKRNCQRSCVCGEEARNLPDRSPEVSN